MGRLYMLGTRGTAYQESDLLTIKSIYGLIPNLECYITSIGTCMPN